MQDIYRKAYHVVVWLGPEADDSLRAAQLLDYLKKFDVDSMSQDELLQVMPPPDDPGWTAVCGLLRRPWFSRLWVVQEVASNDKVVILWRDCSCSMEFFGMCVASIFKWQNIHVRGCEDPKTWKASAMGWSSFQRIRLVKQRPADSKGNLLGLLYLLRNFRCSDPRDHLFALLGLATDCNLTQFAPDYAEPIESVVLRYATNFVKGGMGHHLLRYSSWGSHCQKFPSWIPDWVNHETALPIPISWELNDEQNSPLKYCAAGNTSGRIGFIENGPQELLLVKGFIIDSITDIGRPYHVLHPPMTDGQLNFDGRAVCLFSTENLLAKLTTYPTVEDSKDILWRTLIANSCDNMTLQGTGKNIEASYTGFVQQCWRALDPDAQNTTEFSGGPSSREYDAQFILRMRNRLPCLTARGYLGIVPDAAQTGDQVCIFLGCPLPFILRRSKRPLDDWDVGEDVTLFRIIGHSYIHGIMRGEALQFEGLKEEYLHVY